MGGLPAAALATVAIFLPSFVFVAMLSRVLLFAIESGPARSALDLIRAVTYQLAVASIIDPFTIATLATATVVVFRTKVSAGWRVLVGGVASALCRPASGG